MKKELGNLSQYWWHRLLKVLFVTTEVVWGVSLIMLSVGMIGTGEMDDIFGVWTFFQIVLLLSLLFYYKGVLYIVFGGNK